MSKRQDIIDAIDTKLKTILVAGGFNTDAGNNVFAWRDKPIESAELPALIYRENEISFIESGISGGYDFTMTLLIAVVASGSTSTTEIRKILQDVYTAWGNDDLLGGLICDSKPISDELEVVHEGQKIADALITIEIIYKGFKWEY